MDVSKPPRAELRSPKVDARRAAPIRGDLPPEKIAAAVRITLDEVPPQLSSTGTGRSVATG